MSAQYTHTDTAHTLLQFQLVRAAVATLQPAVNMTPVTHAAARAEGRSVTCFKDSGGS